MASRKSARVPLHKISSDELKKLSPGLQKKVKNAKRNFLYRQRMTEKHWEMKRKYDQLKREKDEDRKLYEHLLAQLRRTIRAYELKIRMLKDTITKLKRELEVYQDRQFILPNDDLDAPNLWDSSFQ